jgi:SARP family transcriptional regulator, regulator of embCAB operon
MRLKVSLLGRLTLEADGIVVDEQRFPGRQGRLVFAYLVSEQGRPVPRDELAEALWGESPPATWEKALTVIVSKLRVLLGQCGVDGTKALTSAFGCYRLDLPEGSSVDVVAAARAAEKAESALAADDLETAGTNAAQAASLARRRFLPGSNGAWVEGKRRELIEILGRALLCGCDASLRSGDAAQAVRLAGEAVALEPFRETGYRHLMEAHGAAGNRGEALQVYEHCRRLLADELGAYPSPETESLYRELLQAAPRPVSVLRKEPEVGQAARVELPPFAPQEPRRRPMFGRRRVLAAAGALVLAGAIAAAVVQLTSSDGSRVVVAPNSVAVIDPETNRVVGYVPVGARPTAVAVGQGGVWVANADDGTVSRIDPTTRQVVKTIGIGAPAIDLAIESDAVWVANGTDGTVSRIDPRENAVTETLDLRGSNSLLPHAIYGVAADAESVWVAAWRQSLLRIDPRTNRVVARIDTEDTPIGVALGEGAVWTATVGERALRVEPSSNAITARVATAFPVAIAAGESGLWVAALPDAVWRINPATGTVTHTIPVGASPLGVSATSGSVWVANGGDGTVTRIDPRTNRVVATIELGYTPTAVSAGEGAVWVSVQREPAT